MYRTDMKQLRARDPARHKKQRIAMLLHEPLLDDASEMRGGSC